MSDTWRQARVTGCSALQALLWWRVHLWLPDRTGNGQSQIRLPASAAFASPIHEPLPPSSPGNRLSLSIPEPLPGRAMPQRSCPEPIPQLRADVAASRQRLLNYFNAPPMKDPKQKPIVRTPMAVEVSYAAMSRSLLSYCGGFAVAGTAGGGSRFWNVPMLLNPRMFTTCRPRPASYCEETTTMECVGYPNAPEHRMSPAWAVLIAAKEDVRADGEGSGAEPTVQLMGFGAGVDTHIVEIVPDAEAHLLLKGSLERLTAATGSPNGPLDVWRNWAALRPDLRDGLVHLRILLQRIPASDRRARVAEQTVTITTRHDSGCKSMSVLRAIASSAPSRRSFARQLRTPGIRFCSCSPTTTKLSV